MYPNSNTGIEQQKISGTQGGGGGGGGGKSAQGFQDQQGFWQNGL